MDAVNFAYWLQGFAELTGDTPPTAAQWQSIREHLAEVFVKVTPPVNDGRIERGPPIQLDQHDWKSSADWLPSKQWPQIDVIPKSGTAGDPDKPTVLLC